MAWITHRYGQAACLGLSLVAVTCRSKPADELLRLAPKLSPEIAVHLVNDDAAEFRVFARHKEAESLGRAVWDLLSAPPTTSLQEFLPVEAAMAPYNRRLIDSFFPDYRLDLLRNRYDSYWRCTPTERLEIVRLNQEKERLEDKELPVAEKADRLLRLIEAYEDFPDIIDPSNLYGEYAGLLTSLRRDAEIPHFLTLGIEAAVRFQDYYMACQLLGTLGFHYGRTGDVEAMESCYDRALAYARRIDSWQEARILSFRASYYRENGQLAIARDLLFEAQDRCRELRVGVKELRPVTDTLKFLASLECWSLVGRGLPRAEMVYRRGRSTLAIGDAELEGIRLQVLRARYCSNVGRCDEARTLALEVAGHIDGWALGAPRTALSRLEAAQALAKCGHDADARPLLEQGLQLCIDAPVSELVDRYVVELSSSQLALGDLQACAKTLQQYPIADGSRIAVRHATIGLRLAMAQQDRAAAFTALQIALQRLAEMESELGASPEGYIALAANDDLRRLGHLLLEESPEAGYAFEMRWRQPAHRGPRFASPGRSEADFVAELAANARQAVARIAAREAMHCVYDVREDAVVRFTATASGISKQRLTCSVPDLQERVSEVCAALSRPAGGARSVSGERTKALRTLAEWLLPESVCTASELPLLLLTANGCLSRLPFEALNLDPRTYVPLLDRSDVATLRYWGSDDPTLSDSVLVVSQPIYSATLQRRYSILKEELPISAVEAQAVQQALPRVIHLQGPDAIKRNLVDRWEHARAIYFAGHLVRNPELPYVMFIPMSQTPSGSEKDSYLEVADVRHADLTNCRLVVLSSCASGASYLDAKVGAPSLADVFLDAGARAVVSTAWAVRDDAAGRVMGSFVREYARDENDPISALCKARREVAAEKPDPHVWVAYSIAVQGLGRASGGPIASADDQATPSLPAPTGAPR